MPWLGWLIGTVAIPAQSAIARVIAKKQARRINLKRICHWAQSLLWAGQTDPGQEPGRSQLRVNDCAYQLALSPADGDSLTLGQRLGRRDAHPVFGKINDLRFKTLAGLRTRHFDGSSDWKAL